LPSLPTLVSPGAIAFHLGPLAIRWYAICITVGFLLATWAGTKIAAKRGIDSDSMLDGAMLGFLGGIVGARLYFAALSWQTFDNPLEIFQIWRGGLSIHGGIIGGVIVAWLFCRRSKISFLDGLDVAGAVLPLAQAIGRWGNFFNSEAYGRPVDGDFPLKLFIPPEDRAPALAQYDYFQPTFLYEAIWNGLIFAVLYFFLFNKFKRFPGMTFLAYIYLYSLGRMLIEPLRTDSIMVGNVAAPLVVSGALLVVSAAGMMLLARYYKGKQKDAPQEKRLDENHGT
jgi:phosphatidylglycerol:prolipoprotein diacylglycerol transferase